MKRIVLFLLTSNIINPVLGQSKISVSLPLIYNKVDFTNNYGPQRTIKGEAIAYGVNFIYSVRPQFITNKKVALMIGLGYLNQRFNVVRPFHFDSPAQVLFYTKHYSYNNLQGIIGLDYTMMLSSNKKYSVDFIILYNWLYTFRQYYVRDASQTTQYSKTQTTTNKYTFGALLSSSLIFKRKLTENYEIGFGLIAPVYTRWRNDRIFEDNPSKYFNPKWSIGLNLSLYVSL